MKFTPRSTYMFLFLFPLLFWCGAAHSKQINFEEILKQSKEEKWHEDPQWQRLLHMRRNIIGRPTSGIDSPEFFLSPKGKHSPAAELKATLTAFFGPEANLAEAACQFPARLKWISGHLEGPFDMPECSRFESWREKMNPSGVTLVFASYYLNNPASMYGHTFLTLNRKGYEKMGGLLDYTVNYAAITNTNNGVLFAVRGLSGLYKGRFSTDPFYFKIQKYNNIESRDLWEYRLDFSADEIDTLLRHLWELGPTWSRYYFFNRNCSYQLLPLLEVAKPNLNASKKFKARAIPLDTLKAVVENSGLVSQAKHRPSHTQIMEARLNKLSAPEKKLAHEIARSGIKTVNSIWTDLPTERRPLVLDGAISIWRRRAGFARDLPEETRAVEREILLERKEFDAMEDDAIVTPPIPPHRGHGTLQLEAAFGSTKVNPFYDLGIRPALHDLNSDPKGFVPGSQLEMFHFRFRHDYERGHFFAKDLTLINILSLPSWNRWTPNPSWGVHARFEPPDDFVDERRLAGVFSGNSGFTFNLFNGADARIYFLGSGEGAAGKMFDKGHRIGAGGRTGLWWPGADWWRIWLDASAYQFFTGDVGSRVRFRGTLTFNMSRDVELRLTGERSNGHSEGRVGLVWNR